MRTPSNPTEPEDSNKALRPESDIILMPEVMDLLGLTKQQVMISIGEGQFPHPIGIKERDLAFHWHEFEEVYSAAKKGASLKEIAELVFVSQQKRIGQSSVF